MEKRIFDLVFGHLGTETRKSSYCWVLCVGIYSYVRQITPVIAYKTWKMVVKEQWNNKRQKKRKGVLTKTLVEYSDATSIHGISYILEDGRLIFERVLWVVLVTLCACASLALTKKIYNNWEQDPITTTIATTEYDIENIEYPSITICAQGSVRDIIGKYVQ